jgi:hypothetical protein
VTAIDAVASLADTTTDLLQIGRQSDSAEFFRRLLASGGFAIEGQPTGSSFTARRK